MSSLPEYRATLEEYLTHERLAETRSEYIDGFIVGMSGGSEAHNVIAANLVTLLNVHLRSEPCRVFGSDMKVHRAESTRFFYPDVSVVCGESVFRDDARDVLMNPILIIEVLSDDTEKFDRGTKFASYIQLASLKEFVLISQHEPIVEHYVRQGLDNWLYSRIEGRSESISLSSVGLVAKLSDIFNKAI